MRPERHGLRLIGLGVARLGQYPRGPRASIAVADRELRHGEGRGSRGARVERQCAEGDEARSRGIHVVVDLGCGGELPPAGGEVTGIARTHTAAIELAGDRRPDLILADIQLADNSSGIDAVNEILYKLGYPEEEVPAPRQEPGVGPTQKENQS